MAVYTEVTDDALTRVPGGLRHRQRGRVPRHRRGRGEQQLLAAHHRGRLHPDAVREARRSGRAAVVPRPDGASGAARHRLPVAGARARRRGAAPAVRPARRHHHVPARRLAAPGAAGALRPGGRRAGGAARRRAPTMRRRGRTRSGRTAGCRCWNAARARADEVQPGLARNWTRRWRRSCAAGHRDCRSATSMPTCFPTTCSSWTASVSGPDRLLFRRDRHPGLRRRGLPQRLVLRAGFFVQRHQGAGHAARL